MEYDEDDLERFSIIMEKFVLSIPDKLDRSVFWFYVLHGESVAQLSDRFDFDEELIIDILYDCQQRARELADFDEDLLDE